MCMGGCLSLRRYFQFQGWSKEGEDFHYVSNLLFQVSTAPKVCIAHAKSERKSVKMLLKSS